MTKFPAPAVSQTAKTVAAPIARDVGELSMSDLDVVSGGVNPQPLPPLAKHIS